MQEVTPPTLNKSKCWVRQTINLKKKIYMIPCFNTYLQSKARKRIPPNAKNHSGKGAKQTEKFISKELKGTM